MVTNYKHVCFLVLDLFSSQFLMFNTVFRFFSVCSVTAFSHDKKFLGSIAHDQMLKVTLSLSLSHSL